jgi:hypothetical protein
MRKEAALVITVTVAALGTAFWAKSRALADADSVGPGISISSYETTGAGGTKSSSRVPIYLDQQTNAFPHGWNQLGVLNPNARTLKILQFR